MSFISRPKLGGDIDAYCTRCKLDMTHTIEAMNEAGEVLRVRCNSCGSQHQFHAPRSPGSSSSLRPGAGAYSSAVRPASPPLRADAPSPAWESKGAPPASTRLSLSDIKEALRDVIREELGITEVEIGDRWKGGTLVLKPGREGLQEKTIPIESLFHKIIMIRDRLRVLEQKINSSGNLSPEEKVSLQQYITGCYGSLTTFNLLFKNKEDWFVGSKEKSEA